MSESKRASQQRPLTGKPEPVRWSVANKLTARQRIDLLLDRGSFIEIDAPATPRCRYFEGGGKTLSGDGVVCGWGTVEGRLIYLFAQTLRVCGPLSEASARKICKVMDLAIENGAPIVGLNDSLGTGVQEGLGCLGGYGEIFVRSTLGSGVIPQISAILGPYLGDAVFLPAITDFIFMVNGTSSMFMTGWQEAPATVAGQEVIPEIQGGAVVHGAHSGLSHFTVPNEAACLATIRHLLSYLPSNNLDDPPSGTSGDDPSREEEPLDYLVPREPDRPYDIKGLILPVVDDGTFLEVHKNYARNLVVGFARLANQSVGIVANQPAYLAGVLDIDATLKGARFVRFCDAFNIPLITFVDVPGFLPGVRQEFSGIIRHGAKLIYAYAEATVPKITIISRKAFGGGYAVMGSKHLRTDVNLAYPTAEIAVMGAEAAVNILYRRELKGLSERSGEVREKRTAEYRRKFSNPFIAAELGYVDAIIEPRTTRPHLIRALHQLAHKRSRMPPKKHGNIPL